MTLFSRSDGPGVKVDLAVDNGLLSSPRTDRINLAACVDCAHYADGTGGYMRRAIVAKMPYGRRDSAARQERQ